jgi:hypothetical protein
MVLYMPQEDRLLDTMLKLPRWEQLPDFGLYMDQVIVLIERTFDGMLPEGEITKSMVNNYVKVQLIPRPVGKKYEREHLTMLLMICILKQSLTMEEIASILTMLCKGGIQAGYAQFIRETEALCEAASSGRIALGQETDDPARLALRAGMTAAICTIYARAIIAHVKNEKK